MHPKGTMVIPMLWRICGYVVCMMGVKNKNHHTHPYVRCALIPASAVATVACDEGTVDTRPILGANEVKYENIIADNAQFMENARSGGGLTKRQPSWTLRGARPCWLDRSALPPH